MTRDEILPMAEEAAENGINAVCEMRSRNAGPEAKIALRTIAAEWFAIEQGLRALVARIADHG